MYVRVHFFFTCNSDSAACAQKRVHARAHTRTHTHAHTTRETERGRETDRQHIRAHTHEHTLTHTHTHTLTHIHSHITTDMGCRLQSRLSHRSLPGHVRGMRCGRAYSVLFCVRVHGEWVARAALSARYYCHLLYMFTGMFFSNVVCARYDTNPVRRQFVACQEPAAE